MTQLTPEERQKVESIKEKIDLTDARTALTFGAPAQKEIADFSEHILSEVRTKDAGPVGELLTSLVTDVRAYDAGQQKGFLEKLPFVGGLAQKVRQKKAGYDKLSAQVSRIEAGLEQARLKMMKDVALFDGLYGHFCLELGVVLFSCLLHGAKLLIFNLSTCIKIREYYTLRCRLSG